jgi:hypothetical protein
LFFFPSVPLFYPTRLDSSPTSRARPPGRTSMAQSSLRRTPQNKPTSVALSVQPSITISPLSLLSPNPVTWLMEICPVPRLEVFPLEQPM